MYNSYSQWEDNMDEEISLVELLATLKKRIGLIINATLIGILVASIYTFFIATPQYNSTTDLLVNRAQTDQPNMIERNEIDTNLQLINTYSDIITRPVILDHVIEELEMDISSVDLQDKLTITNENESQMFSLTVTNDNPYDAATIVNTIASVFQEQMPELMNVDNVAILTTGEPDMTPVSPNNVLNLIIGMVLGAMVGVSTAYLIEFLDNTVKDDKFIIDEIGWASLGRVSEMSPEELASNGRSTNKEADSAPRSRSARV